MRKILFWVVVGFILGVLVGGKYMDIKVKSEQDYSAKLRTQIQDLQSKVSK